MEHVSTPNDCRKIGVVKKVEKSDLCAPSKKSLTFIMQFAAAYHVEKDLSLNSLSEMLLN